MRWLSRSLSGNPLVLLAAGAVLVVSIPVLRRGIRKSAVLTIKTILAGAEKVKKVGSITKESWRDLVDEASPRKEVKGMEDMEDKEYPQSKVVSVIKQGIDVAGKARRTVTGIKKGLYELASETNDTREQENKSSEKGTQE